MIDISYKIIIGKAREIWENGSGGVMIAANIKAKTIAYFLKETNCWIVKTPTLTNNSNITGQIINVDSGQRLAWKTPDIINAKEWKF